MEQTQPKIITVACEYCDGMGNFVIKAYAEDEINDEQIVSCSQCNGTGISQEYEL